MTNGDEAGEGFEKGDDGSADSLIFLAGSGVGEENEGDGMDCASGEGVTVLIGVGAVEGLGTSPGMVGVAGGGVVTCVFMIRSNVSCCLGSSADFLGSIKKDISSDYNYDRGSESICQG